MTTNIDYEQIYQLTFGKQWLELLDLVYKYSRIASTDELVMSAVRTFENEFFEELDRGITKDNLETLLEKLFLLDKGKIYQLSKERSGRIVVELVKLYKSKGLTKQAYDYAKFYPKNEICAEVISEYEGALPTKVITHSQTQTIRVIQNNNIANVNYTTSLFKSRQEMEFFMAVREVFQMFVVYPNVSISCLINFDKIKNELSSEEKSFFFKGIVDCVVFDQHNNYKPIKFFELDSPHHDLQEQKLRDNYKNNILALAGQKLYRIRKISDRQGKTEFIKLIREIAEN